MYGNFFKITKSMFKHVLSRALGCYAPVSDTCIYLEQKVLWFFQSSPEWMDQVGFGRCRCIQLFTFCHLLQNHQINFNQIWHKASLCDEDCSSLFK